MRYLRFYVLVVALVGGLWSFWYYEGHRVIRAFESSAHYIQGLQITQDESLTPQTRQRLAGAAFGRALATSPSPFETGLRVAAAYERARMYEDALTIYDAIIADATPSLGLYLQAAQCAYLLGDVHRAEPYYRAAMRIAPDDPTAYNGLGYLYAEQGVHLGQAEQLVLRALQLHEARRPEGGSVFLGRLDSQRFRLERATFQDSLGWVYFKQGRYEEALEQLRAAASVLGAHPEVRYHLAAAEAEAGDQPPPRPDHSPAPKGRPGPPDRGTRLDA
ncbi:MAG TPA: tetratricopeptide repeat protein [Armatimonadota bacterium]|nr:tetratricopeptide repeat protein [Armatimonadota bacterium]HQK93474.1 tetratricopeptide repeat protein [Armatimonadota bacterium]